MADDLDENFEIGEEFIPGPAQANSTDEEEEEDQVVDEPTNKKRKSQSNTTNTSNSTNQSKRKKKNITEILELRKNEMSKSSFATREFIKILSDYAQKKLSGVEKNDLNISTDMDGRLNKMMLKRKKTHRLDVGEQFKKKFAKKLRFF